MVKHTQKKKKSFFRMLSLSEYDIRMSLYLYWLRKGPLIKYVHNWLGDGGNHAKCYIVYRDALPHISSP